VQLGELAGTFIYPTCAQEAAQDVDRLSKKQQVEHKMTLDIAPVSTENAAALYEKYNFGG
jgi:ribose transport system substrate-binding protein